MTLMYSKPISEQTVIITGAGRGLGAAIAEAFAREGANVAINYRASCADAEALAARLGDRTKAFQADIRQKAEVQRLVDEVESSLGAPCCVVHNALTAFSFMHEPASREGRLDLRWRSILSL